MDCLLSCSSTTTPPNCSAYKPTNSYPLAATNSSPGSSPIAAVQARRRSQYKSSMPVASSSRSSAKTARLGAPDGSDDSQKAFLRTRLKLRCIERAHKARERAVKKKRVMSSSEAGSDDIDAAMDDADEDEEDDALFDELFSRIMCNAERKTQHAYLYSYDREVGSDPGIDEATWETELGAFEAVTEELEDDPALEAYLAEQAAFADFADIPADELFSWSDVVDENLLAGGDMDMS